MAQEKMVPLDTSGNDVEVTLKEEEKKDEVEVKESNIREIPQEETSVEVQEETKEEIENKENKETKENKDELEEYSATVKRRIDKLTRKMRESERREQAAIEYAKKINECNVWLATTGPTEDVSPRYFEVMLSKTLLMCNNMPEQYGGLFVDGVNCVTYENDLSDFTDKLSYYLDNEDERSLIVDNAYDMIINKYTWKHMALNLISEIERIQK